MDNSRRTALTEVHPRSRRAIPGGERARVMNDE